MRNDPQIYKKEAFVMEDLLTELVEMEQLTDTLTVIISMMESEEGNTLSLDTYASSIRAVRDALDRLKKEIGQKTGN